MKRRKTHTSTLLNNKYPSKIPYFSAFIADSCHLLVRVGKWNEACVFQVRCKTISRILSSCMYFIFRVSRWCINEFFNYFFKIFIKIYFGMRILGSTKVVPTNYILLWHLYCKLLRNKFYFIVLVNNVIKSACGININVTKLIH